MKSAKTTRVKHQHLPTNKAERELLRNKGQFWTPQWVADAMVLYCLQGYDAIYDPAVGEGSFLAAAKRVAVELHAEIKLSGGEIDPSAIEKAVSSGELTADDLSGVEVRDFILNPPKRKFRSIVANPPYIRHHRLSPELKTELRRISIKNLGKAIDGRAGLHIYFLIQALSLLAEDGRLCFIMPADTCEGVFSGILWEWVLSNYRLDAVLSFAPDASPFPGVDTNPLVFFIQNKKPAKEFYWAKCNIWGSRSVYEWVGSSFTASSGGLEVHARTVDEGLRTGLSREPDDGKKEEMSLAYYAKVMRGIATGANDFFFLTDEQLESRKIPVDYTVRAIGRTRDANTDVLTTEHLTLLNNDKRPTYLLNIKEERAASELPPALQAYISEGEGAGLNARALIKQRKPWFKMEQRRVPPILFAYLGRRNARFILNDAGIVPLTGFLCVYPHTTDEKKVRSLWRALNHPDTLANLRRVGKSYGDGAVKVEPRNLQNLPLPLHVINKFGLAD